MRYWILMAVLFSVFFAFAQPVLADTVYLKNGRKMVGKVTVKGEEVIIETELGVMSFSRKQVKRIVKDDKTLKVPKDKEKIPEKVDSSKTWKILPDMPFHHLPYARVKAGDKLVAYNPTNGLAIYGKVKTVETEEEERTFTLEEPSKAFFQGSDSEIFSFYKIDTDATLTKLLFFGCKDGDSITLSIEGAEKRNMIFKEISGNSVVLKEEGKTPETLNVKSIFMVENHSSKRRALESFLESKNLKEGDSFTFTESDGTIRMGKLVKKDDELVIESDISGLKVDWGLVDRIKLLSADEYKMRMRRIKASKSEYSPAVKPGDNVNALVATYGKADMEGDGISGRIGIEGANLLGLYTRHFQKAGLWVSSRKDIIYELETTRAFEGKIFGLSLNAPKNEALKTTDIYFYQSNANNPRLMVSETLAQFRVEITLDPKLGKIEKIKITDSIAAGNWVVKAGVIMRRIDKNPGK
jgi:hypothetical protein